MIITNHLVQTKGFKQVERKGLKQVERKELKEGFMVTHQIKSTTWVNQSSHSKWVSRMILESDHFSLCVGACRLL